MHNELRRLQLTELEILKVIDDFCDQHHIQYSLYAGTLLGAVRHRGFIPWDDDLDICMSRDEYNKFLKLWEQFTPEGYILQNKENSPKFSQSFSKIRKDNTTFYQEGETSRRYHMGIFVDIFPIDRMPDGCLRRYLFFWRCMKYQLYTREFVPTQNGRFIRVFSQLLLWMTPKRCRQDKREKLLRKITKNNDNSTFNTVAIEINSTLRTPLPPGLMDDYTDIPFEGNPFKCFKKWDEYLKLKFGDYMQLPPVEQRTWTHHPIIIDFEHNYEDLINNKGEKNETLF